MKLHPAAALRPGVVHLPERGERNGVVRAAGAMRLHAAVALCLSAALGAAPAHAAPVRLPECFVALKGFQGSFRQTQRDERGAELQTHAGRVQSLRPGRLRWEILSPYQELLLSDGRTLLHYQPDLQQLREHPIAGHPLLQLLDGVLQADSADLRLERLRAARGERRYRVRLKRAPDSSAPQSYEFSLRNCLPHRIRWRDELGQSVDIQLHDMSPKPPAVQSFDFRPPAGVERIPHGG